MNSHLQRLQAELARSLHGLDERQTQLRPAVRPDKWSIQQIVSHLRLTYLATTEAMNARIAKGSPTQARPSTLQYAGQFALFQIGYFPKGRKAPERVTAAIEEIALSGTEIAARAADALSIMDGKIDEAAMIFGSRQRAISHMVLGPLSTSQWQQFHLIHGRHHIRQIVKIRVEHGV